MVKSFDNFKLDPIVEPDLGFHEDHGNFDFDHAFLASQFSGCRFEFAWKAESLTFKIDKRAANMTLGCLPFKLLSTDYASRMYIQVSEDIFVKF